MERVKIWVAAILHHSRPVKLSKVNCIPIEIILRVEDGNV